MHYIYIYIYIYICKDGSEFYLRPYFLLSYLHLHFKSYTYCMTKAANRSVCEDIAFRQNCEMCFHVCYLVKKY